MLHYKTIDGDRRDCLYVPSRTYGPPKRVDTYQVVEIQMYTSSKVGTQFQKSVSDRMN